MQSLKPGRGPSLMSAVGGLVGVVFGIFWTVLAYTMTRQAPEPVATIFPLFGVLFVFIGVVNVAYNAYNVVKRRRLSLLDVTAPGEEPDPLNQFVAGASPIAESASIEDRLQALDELRRKGVVSDSEYNAQRQRILNTI